MSLFRINYQEIGECNGSVGEHHISHAWNMQYCYTQRHATVIGVRSSADDTKEIGSAKESKSVRSESEIS